MPNVVKISAKINTMQNTVSTFTALRSSEEFCIKKLTKVRVAPFFD